MPQRFARLCKDAVHRLNLRQSMEFLRKHCAAMLWLVSVFIVLVASVCIALACMDRMPILTGADYGQLLRAFAFLFAAFGVAPVGLILANSRTRMTQEQSQTAQDQSQTAQEQLQTDRQRLVADRFAKSIELLNSDKERVRQGGIFALKNLAENESQDMKAQALTIVAAYIRAEFDAEEEEPRSAPAVELAERRRMQRKKPRLSVDVEACIQVIRESKVGEEEMEKMAKQKGYRFDLSNVSIAQADFYGTDFRYANLSDCKFADCRFDECQFDHANLIHTEFDGDCTFGGAVFTKDTEMERSDTLSGATVEERTPATLPREALSPEQQQIVKKCGANLQ